MPGASPAWCYSVGSVAAGFPLPVRLADPCVRRENLPGDVVAVLLVPEPTPAGMEGVRDLRPEDAPGRRIAVGDVDTRDLVVGVVLAEAAAGGRVDRRRRVAPFGEP